MVIRSKRPDINAELTRIAIHLPFVLLDTASANTPREMEDIVEMVCIFFFGKCSKHFTGLLQLDLVAEF